MPEEKIPPAPPGDRGGLARFFPQLSSWLHKSWSRHRVRYRSKNRAGYRIFTRIVVLAAIITVFAGSIWLGRPQYRHYKERRAARLARAFLEKGDPQNAMLRARQALLLNPRNLAASVVMARLAGQAHSPDEFTWQQRVTELEPTLENKLLLAEIGLHWQRPPFPVTTQVINELAATGATNARYQNIAGQLAIVGHHLAQAESDFAAATRLDPTNAHYALNLALFRLVLTNETQRVESRARLQQLRTNPVYGPAALRGLIKDRLEQKDPATAQEYSAQLLAGPENGLRDQLQNLDILRMLKSTVVTARLHGLQQTAQTNANMAAEISAWMLANGFRGQVLSWLVTLPLQIQNQPPLLLIQAEAYQDAADWQGLRDFTTHSNWGELEYLRFAALSHANAQLREPDLARHNWDLAVNDKTAGSRAALEKLAELAARWQLKPELTDLLERLVRRFPADRAAVQGLTQRYANTGNTAALNQLYARLTAAFPDDTDYQIGLAATSLLLQTNLPAATQWIATAYAHTPENPQIATVYAYALYLDRQDAEGIAVLKKLTPAELAQPSSALYYGLLLVAAGHTAEAATWLASARTKITAMLPEERQLLAAVLGGK